MLPAQCTSGTTGSNTRFDLNSYVVLYATVTQIYVLSFFSGNLCKPQGFEKNRAATRASFLFCCRASYCASLFRHDNGADPFPGLFLAYLLSLASLWVLLPPLSKQTPKWGLARHGLRLVGLRG